LIEPTIVEIRLRPSIELSIASGAFSRM
jgi:hypothetical protein